MSFSLNIDTFCHHHTTHFCIFLVEYYVKIALFLLFSGINQTVHLCRTAYLLFIPMLIISDNNPCFHMIFPKSADFTFYQIRASQRGSRFFMLLIPISRVDVLWHSADVVGCITPATPRTINNVLKPTIVL